MLLLIWTLLGLANAEVAEGHHAEGEWNYDNQDAWGELYPACNGIRQSPINIDTTAVEEDSTLADFSFINYDKPVSGTITNNGHSVQLNVGDQEERGVQGSGLPEGCKLIQFHFHWGSQPTAGSEHLVNGQSYSMEVHLVHQCNEGKLLVVGTFLQESAIKSPGLDPLVNVLENIKYKGKESQLNSFDLQELLPQNQKYFFSYLGSLTTPGCSEIVTWIVNGNPIRIGTSQIQKFRSVYSTSESAEHQHRLQDNYREIQPLNDRKVTVFREDFKR